MMTGNHCAERCSAPAERGSAVMSRSCRAARRATKSLMVACKTASIALAASACTKCNGLAFAPYALPTTAKIVVFVSSTPNPALAVFKASYSLPGTELAAGTTPTSNSCSSTNAVAPPGSTHSFISTSTAQGPADPFLMRLPPHTTAATSGRRSSAPPTASRCTNAVPPRVEPSNQPYAVESANTKANSGNAIGQPSGWPFGAAAMLNGFSLLATLQPFVVFHVLDCCCLTPLLFLLCGLPTKIWNKQTCLLLCCTTQELRLQRFLSTTLAVSNSSSNSLHDTDLQLLWAGQVSPHADPFNATTRHHPHLLLGASL